MLAHHPVTSAPIRILRTETQISADAKTLVWVRSTFAPSERWGRWFIAVSEPDAVALCGNAADITAVVLDVDADPAAWSSVLPTICCEGSETLLLAPAAVVDRFAAAGLTCERTLLMEDLYDTYPYLGEPLSPRSRAAAAADELVAKGVVALAHVLRMNRLAWSLGADRDALPFGARTMVDAAAASAGLRLLGLPNDATDAVVPRLWLVQQYFQHSNARRHREIRTCLERNLACPYVDHVL